MPLGSHHFLESDLPKMRKNFPRRGIKQVRQNAVADG
jgi:hypothetical protein